MRELAVWATYSIVTGRFLCLDCHRGDLRFSRPGHFLFFSAGRDKQQGSYSGDKNTGHYTTIFHPTLLTVSGSFKITGECRCPSGTSITLNEPYPKAAKDFFI